MKKMKKLLALVLVLAMALSLSVTAWAGTITVNSESKDDVYTAYQIFDGDLSESIMTNITWGSGVDGDALLNDLRALPDFAGAASAGDVAQVLEAYTSDSDAMRQFADIAARHVSNGADLVYNTASKLYESPHLDDGYYLVKQDQAGVHDNGTDGAKSRFIVRLVGHANIEPKASVPEVDKGVMEDSAYTDVMDLNAYHKTADYDIGQVIPYYIAGTLPSTYADYKQYYYKFTDHMSNGLTYVDQSVRVFLYNGPTVEQDVTDYFEIQWNAADHTLVVECDDIKDFAMDHHEKIVVFYQAVLNKDAVIGNPGNPNDVYLTFSNNPNQEKGGIPEAGDTPKKYCVVFTYALDATKVDDVEEDRRLQDAEFILRHNASGKYAVVSNGMFVEWVEAMDQASVLKTDADGTLKIRGLDADEYTLIETKAPVGYNLGGPFEFAIHAEMPDTVSVDGGELKMLEITTGSGNSYGNLATGEVYMTITNTRGSTLPSTGGVGTTLFYIFGGLLLVGGGVLLITRKRLA